VNSDAVAPQTSSSHGLGSNEHISLFKGGAWVLARESPGMELDWPSHRRKTTLFRGIGAVWESARKKGGEGAPCKTEATKCHRLRVGGENLSSLPRASCPGVLCTRLVAGGGTLNDGLTAEEVEGEGAEEGRDAVLAKQVEFDELPDGSRELGFQKLHFSTGGAGGLRVKKNKPVVNWQGFNSPPMMRGELVPSP